MAVSAEHHWCYSGSILHNTCIVLPLHSVCPWQYVSFDNGVKLLQCTADLLVSVLSEMVLGCSTSTLREAMALTVSASSSDWPRAPIGPSISEWPLVWDKLWRQDQCLPSRTERERDTHRLRVKMYWASHCWIYSMCICLCVCAFLTLDLYYSL